jgi:hypothetical protein
VGTLHLRALAFRLTLTLEYLDLSYMDLKGFKGQIEFKL